MSNSIGNKLKELRKQKGLSQEQVCDFLKISQSAYARIESGESNSWAMHLDKITSLYNIKPEELFMEDKVIINNNQQGGVGYAETINQLSEKLIEQYDARLKEKEEQIISLTQEINKLKQS
jgi:transcriptional regulator with XRE-family HTH domain